MSIKKRPSIWLLPLLALLCLGWADSWEQLGAAAGTVSSVRAEFVQEKHLPILAKPLESSGAFYFQAPRSLRWEYRSPIKSILVMYEGRVRRFVAGTAGFTEESGAGLDAMQVVVEEISHWLAGRFDDNPMFAAELEPGRRIVLTPKAAAMGKVIQRIVLNLSQQPGVIDSVVIYESDDAYTRMTFSHTVLNEKIDEHLFRDIP